MEMLKQYWYIVAGLVVYMMFGKKKRKKSSRRRRNKMKALKIANSRLRRKAMYARMRPRTRVIYRR